MLKSVFFASKKVYRNFKVHHTHACVSFSQLKDDCTTEAIPSDMPVMIRSLMQQYPGVFGGSTQLNQGAAGVTFTLPCIDRHFLLSAITLLVCNQTYYVCVCYHQSRITSRFKSNGWTMGGRLSSSAGKVSISLFETDPCLFRLVGAFDH